MSKLEHWSISAESKETHLVADALSQWRCTLDNRGAFRGPASYRAAFTRHLLMLSGMGAAPTSASLSILSTSYTGARK